MFIVIIILIMFGLGYFLGYFLSRNKNLSIENELEKIAEIRFQLKEKENELDEKLMICNSTISKIISYEELETENGVLTRDLQNLDVYCHKIKLDQNNLEKKQNLLDKKCNEVGQKYLDDSVKWLSKKMTPNNYVETKNRLTGIIDKCRDINLVISKEQEDQLLDDLKKQYELIVRAEFEKQEQNRIKAQIREEKRREKEFEDEIKRLDNERAAIANALELALKDSEDKHSQEIENLRQRLKEAEEKAQRAISQAQLTRSGYVYVISNIGSFGKDIFKIGMTRRLEPSERVKELSGASVPFPFDVHMMISSEDAPTLENSMHKALYRHKINKVNPRKEFFKVDIETIKEIVEKHHNSEISYIADPEALEYNESQNILEADVEFIESTYSFYDDESEED